MKNNGKPSGWGYTFLRDLAVKGPFIILAIWIANGLNLPEMLGMTWFAKGSIWSEAQYYLLVIGGILTVVDYLWAIADKRGRCLHDLVMGTIVVRTRR